MAYLQYNKANEDMNCMSGTRPDGIAIFLSFIYFAMAQVVEYGWMVWCYFQFHSRFSNFFRVVRIGQDSLGYDFS